MDKTPIKEKRSGKTNRWGVLMAITMMFTISFMMYPPMRNFVFLGIGVMLVSGFMALRQIKREGWP